MSEHDARDAASGSPVREPASPLGALGRAIGLGVPGRFSDRAVRERNESAWLLPNDGSRTDHVLRRDMRRYADTDEVDLVIVGAGAGGGVLAQRMARRGWSVVALDAGPFWDPDADWVSDERGSHGLYWTEPRVIGGSDPVPLGSNNSGRGVGGSLIHYSGFVPRFHPSDFRTRSVDGVGVDWPISYDDLRPHYEAVEAELPVAGQDWPWGDPHSYPQHAHPVGGNGDLFLRGCAAAGVQARVGPVAITNGRFGNRPHCIYRGFCQQGCKVNAKASPLITHIPDALAHGAEVRAHCHVSRVLVDDERERATGVVYLRDGVEHRQRAKAVAVAGYSIETPRLLMLSATERHPAGLGNDHDLLGRYLMVQGAPQTAGRFAEEVRMNKAQVPEASSEHFYETDPSAPYKRGWSLQTVGPLPITWSEHIAAQGHWGAPLREYMRDYNHWAVIGALAELLPQARNRVTLADEVDRHGLPVARFDYSMCENDEALIAAATASMERVMHAAGAQETITVQRFAHLVGGCRMAARAEDGVVDVDHRVFGMDNLFVTDGSTLPTQGAANPGLTIMAMVARAAERIESLGRR